MLEPGEWVVIAATQEELATENQNTLDEISQSAVEEGQQQIQDEDALSNPQYAEYDSYGDYEGTTGLGGLAV